MSQQIRVLQCGECSLYQVDIIRKSNSKKWECKVCRQKQTLLTEFFRGSGAECRQKVQELNLQHGQKCQSLDNNTILKVHKQEECKSAQNQESKWASYVDKPAAFPNPNKMKYEELCEPEEELPNEVPLSIRNRTKRPAQNATVSTKKKCSKWEGFL